MVLPECLIDRSHYLLRSYDYHENTLDKSDVQSEEIYRL